MAGYIVKVEVYFIVVLVVPPRFRCCKVLYYILICILLNINEFYFYMD